MLGFILAFSFDPCLNKEHAYVHIHQLLALPNLTLIRFMENLKTFLEKTYESIHIHIAHKNQSQWKGYGKYQEKKYLSFKA